MGGGGFFSNPLKSVMHIATLGLTYQQEKEREAAKEAAEEQARAQQEALKQQKKAAVATQVQQNKANAQKVNADQILANTENGMQTNNLTSAFGAVMNPVIGSLSGLSKNDKNMLGG